MPHDFALRARAALGPPVPVTVGDAILSAELVLALRDLAAGRFVPDVLMRALRGLPTPLLPPGLPRRALEMLRPAWVRFVPTSPDLPDAA